MFRLTVRSHFDAAHRIGSYVGKCNRMHGHRWEVEVVLEGDTLDARNILVDFGEVKSSLNFYLEQSYDHSVLNETFQEHNVTAEYLARRIFDDMKLLIPTIIRLVQVTVWESPECSVSYMEGSGL